MIGLRPLPSVNPNGAAAAKLYQELEWLPPNKLPNLILSSQGIAEAWSLPNCLQAMRGVPQMTLPWPGLRHDCAMWIHDRALKLMSKAHSAIRGGCDPPKIVRLKKQTRNMIGNGSHKKWAPTHQEHAWFAWLKDVAEYLDLFSKLRVVQHLEKDIDKAAVVKLCAHTQDLLTACLECRTRDGYPLVVTAEELSGICFGLGELVRTSSHSELRALQVNLPVIHNLMKAFYDRRNHVCCNLTVLANFQTGLRLLSKYSAIVRDNLVGTELSKDWLEGITSCVCEWSTKQQVRMLNDDVQEKQMNLYTIMRTIADFGGCWQCVTFIKDVFLPGSHPQNVTHPESLMFMLSTCKAVLRKDGKQSHGLDPKSLPSFNAVAIKTHTSVMESMQKLLMQIVHHTWPYLQNFAPYQITDLLLILGSLKSLPPTFFLDVLKVAAQQLRTQVLGELDVVRPLLDFAEKSSDASLSVKQSWTTDEVASLLFYAGHYGQEVCDIGRRGVYSIADPADNIRPSEGDPRVMQDATQGLPLHAWQFPQNMPLTQSLRDVLKAASGILTNSRVKQMTLSQLSFLVSALHQLQACNKDVHSAAGELLHRLGCAALHLLGIPQRGAASDELSVRAPSNTLTLEQYSQLLWGLSCSGIVPQHPLVFSIVGKRIVTALNANVARVHVWKPETRGTAVKFFNSATQLLTVLARAIEVYPPEAKTLPKECVDAVLETMRLGLQLNQGSEASSLEFEATARLMDAAATLSTSPHASKLRTSAAQQVTNQFFETVMLATFGPGDPDDLCSTFHQTVGSPEILADMLCACGQQGLHHAVRKSALAELLLQTCKENLNEWVTSWHRGQHWLGRFLWGLVAVSAHSSSTPSVLRELALQVASALPSVSAVAGMSSAAAADLLALAWVFAVLGVQNDDASQQMMLQLSRATKKRLAEHLHTSTKSSIWQLCLAWEVMQLTGSCDSAQCEALGDWASTAQQAWNLQKTGSRLSSESKCHLQEVLKKLEELDLPFQMEAGVNGFVVDALLDASAGKHGSWCIEVVRDADLPPDPAIAALAPSPQTHNYGREQAKRLHLHREGFQVVQIWESTLRPAGPAAQAIHDVIEAAFKASQVKAEHSQFDEEPPDQDADCGEQAMEDSASEHASLSGAAQDGSSSTPNQSWTLTPEVRATEETGATLESTSTPEVRASPDTRATVESASTSEVRATQETGAALTHSPSTHPDSGMQSAVDGSHTAPGGHAAEQVQAIPMECAEDGSHTEPGVHASEEVQATPMECAEDGSHTEPGAHGNELVQATPDTASFTITVNTASAEHFLGMVSLDGGLHLGNRPLHSEGEQAHTPMQAPELVHDHSQDSEEVKEETQSVATRTVATNEACWGGDDDEFDVLSDDELEMCFAEMIHSEEPEINWFFWVSVEARIAATMSEQQAEYLFLGAVQGILGIVDDNITFCCQESPELCEMRNTIERLENRMHQASAQENYREAARLKNEVIALRSKDTGRTQQYFLGFQLESDMRNALSAPELRYLRLRQVATEGRPRKRQRVH